MIAFAVGGDHRGFDRLDQFGQVARQLDALLDHFDRRGNGASHREDDSDGDLAMGAGTLW